MPRQRPTNCDMCLEEFYTDEEYIDDALYIRNANRYNGDWLCENCYERAREEQEDSFEEDYYEDSADSHYPGILSYSSKPLPEFYHFNELHQDLNINDGIVVSPGPKTFIHKNKQINLPYLSCELETEAPSYADLHNEAVKLGTATNHLVYCKQDCSIHYGFEIVSQPMTLDFIHNKTDKFKKEIDRMRASGWRAWDASNCGFHIHLEKKSFVNELHQMKFIYFIFNNKEKMVKFTGRNSSYASYELDYFLNVNGDEWRLEKPTIVKAIKNREENGLTHYNRNTAINIMPENTCELRVFKPSMRFETLVAYFEFTHCLWQYTKDISYFDIYHKKGLKNFNTSFKEFAMDHIDMYPQFVQRATNRKVFEETESI